MEGLVSLWQVRVNDHLEEATCILQELNMDD